MNKISLFVIVINLLIILGVVNYLSLEKQTVIKQGKTVFLELAPVDPRSLMQGDYMILRQQLSSSIPNKTNRTKDIPTRGRVVLKLDERNIGTFARFDSDEALKENEVLIKYRHSNRGYLFGLESFFFEEGMAKVYENAKYCEVKIDDQGHAVLINLRGEELAELVKQTD